MTLIYTIPAVRHAWADSAPAWNGTTGDIADPGDTAVAAGWQKTQPPPPYQYFNWALNWASSAIRYIMQNGIVDWQAAELYQTGAIVVRNNVVYQSLVTNNTNNDPATSTLKWGPLAGYATTAMLAPLVTTTQLLADLAAYAPIAGPTFTGIPRAPTASAGDASTIIANTSFVAAAIVAALAPYLKTATAASTYLSIANAAAQYLTLSAAASTYLTQTAAASLYATQAFATGTFSKQVNFEWDVAPSGIQTVSGVTGSIPQGVDTLFTFPKSFPNRCVSVVLTPFGSTSAAYVLVSFNTTSFTMRTGAGEPFTYMARGY